MGAYLSQPKTDKVSTLSESELLLVGASSMQGWRNSQEDAHNAILDFDTNTSFFAVYDGHGGAEVATFCADRLPDFLKTLDSYKIGKLEEALCKAFLEFDRTLLEPEIVEVLKILAGDRNVEDSECEEEEENLVELHEESNLPLNKLLEKYKGHPAMPALADLKNEAGGNSSGGGGSKPQSPYLRGRRTAAIVAQATNKALMDPDSKPAGSSTSAAALAASSNDASPSSSGSSKAAATALGSVRTEPVDDSTVSSSSNSSGSGSGSSGSDSAKVHNNIPKKNSSKEAEAASNTNGSMNDKRNESAEATAAPKPDSSHAAMKESDQNGSVTSSEANAIITSAASSSKVTQDDTAVSSGSNEEANTKVIKQNGTVDSSTVGVQKSPAKIDGGAISSTTSKEVEAKKVDSLPILSGGGDEDSADEDAEYQVKKLSEGSSEEELDEDDDDDDDEEDEEVDREIDSDENGSDAETTDDFEEEEEEDEEDEDTIMANQQFCANMIEEPGKDSGCTAVVALLHGRDLYVANAGDSRCVVCRNGKAIEMSLDHKPEDEEESARIIKAGGRVTLDGRVNGGLNLSRAIGDHAYKMNSDLPLEEQMISARPDIKKLIISPEDEFMILACDGIWNFMSSEEVVDFVRVRLIDQAKSVSEICEELFDHCLAPDTMGDGTGCDNMTAVIVRFKPKILELPTQIKPEEAEDALLKTQKTTKVDPADADQIDESQKKAQKRTASPTEDLETSSNEAEHASKTKRLKTDNILGENKDNKANTSPMEVDQTNDSNVTSEKSLKSEETCSKVEQNECDSLVDAAAATAAQSPTPIVPAVSTTDLKTFQTLTEKTAKIDSLTLEERPNAVQKWTAKEGTSNKVTTVNSVPEDLVLITGGGGARNLSGNPSQYVKLNVGGCLYYTTISTLTKHDNMLSAMFSGHYSVLTDSEGWILIDRCGTHFGTILNFLRDGSVPLPESHKEIAELLAESKYYCITELALSCERALLSHQEPKAICRIPLITSQKEEQMLISTSTKPAVILVVQRQNNKYSYTSTSDDNLLKNIELFDKLSLRFNERILFIKDVIGPSEICCWSFYGHGKKVAEVCCTSIVYATDRKHTKVEFPEARIYEETLQVLLYENRNAPDQELLQATSSVRGGAAGGMHQYTSDEEEERTGLARLRSNKRNNPT